MEYLRLSNGVEMPKLGYGVWQIPDDQAADCVAQAIDVGYRLIDTARFYENEHGVGKGIAASGVPRDQIFLVDKVWPCDFGEQRAYDAIVESLGRMGVDYFDLVFLHQAYNDVFGAWRGLERAYDEGLVRSIGVSNFNVHRLVDICGFSRITPMVNQLETHVYWQQASLHRKLSELGIAHMAWSPLVGGERDMFHDEVLMEIGAAHGKSAAQVALRYLLDQDIVAIPKSSHRARMEENLDVFDFELTEEDRSRIRALDEDAPVCVNHNLPETTEMMVNLTKYLMSGGTLAQLAAMQQQSKE